LNPGKRLNSESWLEDQNWQFPWTTERTSIQLDAIIVHIATGAVEMSWVVVV
jgi:hypothetical protein